MPNNPLNVVDNLSTTNTAAQLALTANQGKILWDTKITGKMGTAAASSAGMDNDSIYLQYGTTSNTDFITNLKNYYYPVGSIYMSTTSTSPVTLFGGTWDPIESRILICNDSTTYTAGNTGGATTVTLTSAQTGKVNHATSYASDHTHTFVINMRRNIQAGTNRGIYHNDGTNAPTYNSSEDGAHTHTVAAANASNSHTNMPPYLAVYMWKRTG